MKNQRTIIVRFAFALVGVLAFGACNTQKTQSGASSTTTSYRVTYLPSDVQLDSSCIIDRNILSSWSKGTYTAFTPAPSTQFDGTAGNPTFFKWAQRMFLWITSKDTKGARTLETPTFFAVSTGDTLASNAVNPGMLRATHIVNKAKSNPQDTITSEGQAGGSNVIRTASGSFVYYITFVNDVYAYFLTQNGHPHGKDSAALRFPTTSADALIIQKFAQTKKVTLSDTNALAMEVKTAWVDASTLPDTGNSYITVKAMIPTFDTTNSIAWKATGERTAKLALIGMHIVGSAKGHPEMIWATFEHQSNAPNMSYYYNASPAGNPKVYTGDTQTNWLLCQSKSANPNRQQITASSNRINSDDKTTPIINIQSNITRVNPWGSLPDTKSSSQTNTQVITINSTLRSAVKGTKLDGDVRLNYLFMGAIWTDGGKAPTNNNTLGTTVLANTTMESVHQDTSEIGPIGCFNCHSGSLSPASPFQLSHIYSNLTPLPASFGGQHGFRLMRMTQNKKSPGLKVK